jgi:hypothetical protein
LKLEVAIHGEKGIYLAHGLPQQLAVLHARPTEPLDGGYIVPHQRRS